MNTLTGFIACDSNGQRLVLGEFESADDLQISQRWISAQNPMEVEP